MWAAFLFGGVCGFLAGSLLTALIAIGWIKWSLEAQEPFDVFAENELDQAVEPEARIDAWGSPMVVDRRDWPGDQAVER